MDNYRIVKVKVFSVCGVMCTAVLWRDVIDNIGDMLFVWCMV